MDVEKTLEALLQSHVRADRRMEQIDRRMEQIDRRMEKTDLRMEQIDRRMEKTDLRMEQADRRMDKFDTKLEATRKLVEAGIKLVTNLGKGQKELQYKISALTDAQIRADERMRKSDAKFDQLMAALLRKNTNGHR